MLRIVPELHHIKMSIGAAHQDAPAPRPASAARVVPLQPKCSSRPRLFTPRAAQRGPAVLACRGRALPFARDNSDESDTLVRATTVARLANPTSLPHPVCDIEHFHSHTNAASSNVKCSLAREAGVNFDFPYPTTKQAISTASSAPCRSPPAAPPTQSPSPSRNRHALPQPPPHAHRHVAQTSASRSNLALRNNSGAPSALPPNSQSSPDGSPPTSTIHPAHPAKKILVTHSFKCASTPYP